MLNILVHARVALCMLLCHNARQCSIQLASDLIAPFRDVHGGRPSGTHSRDPLNQLLSYSVCTRCSWLSSMTKLNVGVACAVPAETG